MMSVVFDLQVNRYFSSSFEFWFRRSSKCLFKMALDAAILDFDRNDLNCF